MWYWLFKYVLAGPVVRLRYRVVAIGAHNLPRRGAAILAANHLAESDSLLIPLSTGRRITFVAKAEYFGRRSWRRWGLRRAGQIPIDRTGGESAKAALDAAGTIVANDGVWAIYPEGTRSPDGRLHKGHTGCARVALQHDVPIVPVAIVRDTSERRWRRTTMIRYGAPMNPSGSARELTDAVMDEIARLSGQSRSGGYASR